ncbi:hypothetical protein IEO21_01299 [Rhodonia placenta]|uniref:Transcriptional regulator of RNA polII, SAGA, subunit-domain-containing protein n=1 Tax=Rhodonia placenta TaxID=104341 RepID=A0A8H7P9S7_9APHY|nr:hypothetical protein IEO21_01299 [Postia placenta]
MSLPSTTTSRHQLISALGPKAPSYWTALKEYLCARISRVEFDEQVKELLDTTHLRLPVQLHNSLIVSLFDTSAHLAPPTPPPDVPKPPARKRRRTLPYQGADTFDPTSLRSSRLKRWTVGLGRRERERVRHLEAAAVALDQRPQIHKDEIAAERGVQLVPERGEPPGSRLPLHLASSSRGFTLQHISDRINLICAQHNLGAPSKSVSSLMMLAFEVRCVNMFVASFTDVADAQAKLKQIISQALSLTSTSHAITSIKTSTRISNNHVLSTSAFDTLFTVSPSVLPNKSAAAMRLALGDNECEEEPSLKDRDEHIERHQLLALLSERSTVRDALRILR